MSLISLDSITKKYLDKNTVNTVFENISLTIEQGEFVAISGRSGIGKSTLLHLMCGLDRPSAGDVIYQNIKFSTISDARLARFRNQHFGLVFQQPFTLSDLSVLENCQLAGRYQNRMSRSACRKRACELLDYVGLKEMQHRLPQTLSGGELQRLGVARALFSDPEVVFADEPTVSLDHDNAQRVMKLLKEQHEQGRTVVLISHDAHVLGWATRVISMAALIGEDSD